MLNAQNIYKSYNNQPVLNGVSLSATSGARIGLIGDNGSGKTTLLKVIAGELKPDGGNVSGNHNAKLLPQEPNLHSQSLKTYLAQYDVDVRYIGKVLGDAGLDQSKTSRLLAELSGGERTRLGIAALLAQRPSILLLDEPTNNLDAPALLSLETALLKFRGTIIFASHDRAFLNKIATDIVDLKDGHIERYGGNYDFYKEQLQLEKDARRRDYASNQKQRRKLKQTAQMFNRRAQGLSKKEPRDNDKALFKGHIAKARLAFERTRKNIENRLERMPDLKQEKLRIDYPFGFSGEAHKHKLILEACNIEKSYGERLALNGVSLQVYGSQRWQVSGENGAGKSTLLRVIAGKDVANSGTLTLGEAVKLSYFSQDANLLNRDELAISELLKSGASRTDCYKMATCLHIPADHLEKKVADLSRGQATKLCFAYMLLSPSNLLILDEPTNHLEIETREQIEDALSQYKGAIIIASHDSYFSEAIAVNHVLKLRNNS